MRKMNIMILDDEEIIHKGIASYLTGQSYNVYSEYDPLKAISVLKKTKIDVMILDIMLPGMNGIDVLKKIKSEQPDVEVIMITGYENTGNIMNAIKYGAFDYFYKPLSMIEIEHSIKRTNKFIELNKEAKKINDDCCLSSEEDKAKIGESIIGESKEIKEIQKLIDRASLSESTSVLITGESGTGKELIARKIHYSSARKNNCFFPINSAAIPETLVESEFFGHLKGSFTGANEDKKGCFESANRGTLFIDEIADMSLAAQSKILRALETKKIKRVGSNEEINIDVRIIAATNKNLKKLINENTFRLDLYYRLNIFEIHVPSLKERKSDIPMLLEYYITHFSILLNKPIRNINDDVYKVLSDYDFPGNIRELKNMTERAVILSDDAHIKLNHFPLSEFKPVEPAVPDNADDLNLEEKEVFLIKKALEKSGNNITAASALLGISRTALHRKIKKFRI